MAEESNIVNLPAAYTDLVGDYEVNYTPPTGLGVGSEPDYHQSIDAFIADQNKTKILPSVDSKDVPFTERYPIYFPGEDNEERYAQAQGGWEKAYNGIVKMAGTATSTFISNTAGLVYGVNEAVKTGRFASIYDNKVFRELNEWTNGLEDSYAHYKTLREREGSWWEPANLFTGNFLFDGVIKNLGFSLGAIGGGLVWGSLLKAIGATAKLVSMGTEMATKADAVIGEATTLAQVERLGAINNGLDALLNQARGAVSKGLMNSDRAIVAIMGSIGEGGIEALTNTQEFRKKMIDDFIAVHGHSPNKEQLAEINQYSEDVGNWSLVLNVGLLSATQYIQLPKILSSTYKGEKQIVNNIMHDGSKYVSTLPQKGFGKLLYKSINVVGLFFNTTEGFEEGAQYAIQTGTQNYFNKKSRGENPSVLDDGILHGAHEALYTDEGTLNIFLGAFSGALQTSGIHTLGKSGKIGERGITGYGGSEGALRASAIDALNKSLIKDNLKAAYSNVKAAEIIQQERESAIRQGDILESKDLEFDYAHTFITSRLKHGAKEFIKQEIDNLKEEASTTQGFLKLQQLGIAPTTDTQEAFIARLNNLQEHANNASELQDALNLKYKGLVDPETKKPIYSEKIIEKMVYAGAKVMDYNRRIPQVNAELLNAGILNTQELVDKVLAGETLEIDEVTATMLAIDALESKGMNDDKIDDLKTNLKDLLEMSLRKKQFIDEYNEIKKSPEKFKDVEVTAEDKEQEGETVTVTTKKGEKEVVIGKEYYLGNVFDADGKPRYPKLTILGKDENGIKIKDANGIRYISEDQLLDYQLGLVSDIDKSENSRFYYRNIVSQPGTKTFWNRGATKGGVQEGHLRYNPIKDELLFKFWQNGKQRSIPVGIDSFTAKEGFEHGIFYFDHTLTTEDKADIAKRKESGKTAEDQRIRRKDRLEVLNELYDEVAKEQSAVNKLLDSKKAELANIIARLDKIIEEINQPDVIDKRVKGKIRFNKYGTYLLQTARKLEKSREQLEKQIDALVSRNEQIDTTAAYLMNMMDDIDIMPSSIDELTAELKDHIETLNMLGKATQDQIDEIRGLIPSLIKAIDAAIEMLQDFIKAFHQKFAHDEFVSSQDTWKDVVTNPNFLDASRKKQVAITNQFNDDLMALNLLIAETEDYEINPNRQKVIELKEKLIALEKELSEITAEEAAMTHIYERFKKVAEAYKLQEEEEERLQQNDKLIKEAIGTADKKNVETTNPTKWYEAVRKKAVEFIWRSTMGVRRGLPHQERANTFGFNFEKFKNKDDIRGIFITSNNQNDIGLPGLMTRLVTDIEGNVKEDIDQDDIIAMVMIDTDGNLLGQDGQPLTDEQLKNPLDHAIYQVLPAKNLEWSEEYRDKDGSVSMFRKGTDEDVKNAIIEQYNNMREEIKASAKGVNNNIHSIRASFGIPSYAQMIDENGDPMWSDAEKTIPMLDYNTRTPVEEAGLLRDDETDGILDAFFGDILITIPKITDVAEAGTTQYTDANGRPFLNLPNAVVPLQNRRHTASEAETIFQALLQSARYMMDPDKGIDSDESTRLFNWLKSVVYWGIPKKKDGSDKPVGYNSIFWKKDTDGKFVLTISGKGETFLYTPSELLKNKETIVNMIQLMFMNINASQLNELSEGYEEILSISPTGEVKSRMWANYQTFLLSNKFIPFKRNDKNRPARKDVPLTTVLVPVTATNPVNRTGIYFYTDDNEGEIEIPEPKSKLKTLTAGKLNPNKPSEEKKPVKKEVTKSEGKYVADGTTMYQFPIPAKEGKVYIVNFVINPDGEVIIHPGADLKAVIESYKKLIASLNPDVTIPDKQLTDTAKNAIKKAVTKTVTPDIITEEEGSEEEEEDDDDNDIEELEAEELSDEDEDEDVNNKVNAAINKAKSNKRSPFRKAGNVQSFVKEDWIKLEKWLAANFPNLPVYRVKNLIKGLNGEEGWGMFHDAALYIYQNAEVGTAYHEVFHAVWSIFATLEERKAIRKEFRNRSGSFVDRPTGKTINYSEATNKQINEQLAEEFRNYVTDKKIPAKPNKGRPFILKLFADLVSAIKTFFFGPSAQSKVEEMFANINQGAYKNHIPNANQFAYAKAGVIDIEDAFATAESELSLVSISDKERSEILQEMTYIFIRNITQTDNDLFNVVNRDKSFYEDINDQLLETVARKIVIAQDEIKSKTLSKEEVQDRKDTIKRTTQLMKNIQKQWPEIVSRHEEYMKAYGVEFDENDKLALNSDKGKGDTYAEANKIDSFKKAHSAIKLLLATIPVLDKDGYEKESSIGGVVLVPMSEVFINLMNTLHNSRSIEDMLAKLQVMATEDPNYRALYRRIVKRSYTDAINLSDITTDKGLRLLAAFWATFKKQNPEVKNVYILDNGEVVVGDANLSSGAAQLREDYRNAIIFKAKEKSKYFIYDEKKKSYVGNPIAVAESLRKEDLPSLVKFLSNIGIEFDLKKVQTLRGENRIKFKNAVLGIKTSISEGKEIVSFSKKALDINGNLLNLGYIQEMLTHPEFDSTFFNVVGERTQSFIGTNPASQLHNFLSQIKRFDQDNVGDSQYAYLLPDGDSFAQGSNILSRMFDPGGKRKQDPLSQNLMRVVYIGGTDNQIKGKQKQSSKLNQKERLVQEINLNIDGYYLNLVPGDASMEWALYTGNAISLNSINSGYTAINELFKNYFIAELNLVREASERKLSMAKDRNPKEMRFFKAILQDKRTQSDKLHNEILAYEGTPEAVYEHFQTRINNAIKSHINSQNKSFQQTLEEYGILNQLENGWEFENINFENIANDATLERHLTFLNVNFMIANIEMHKLLYGDPYQYADELKRTKNFNSPGQALISNSPEMNAAFDRIWNKNFTRGESGWTDFHRDFFRSVTHKDVMGRIEGLEDYVTPFKETDGGGIITFSAYRNFRIRIGDWNDDEERQYGHDMDYEDLAKSGATAEELKEFDKDNPGIRSAYTPLKPIVRGNKANGQKFNQIILDKFALYPLSYRLMSATNIAAGKSTSNALALYNKMRREDIDYIVFESSRKVGATNPHATYNSDGSFNDTPYSKTSIINVPYSIIDVQADVPSKDDGSVTRGSQATKLITMDYMEAGVPLDFMPDEKNFTTRYNAWYNIKTREEREVASPLYKEMRHNQDLLEAITEQGYQTLLNQLGIKEEIVEVKRKGIVEVKRKYTVTDLSLAGETLRGEILKRAVNDNVSDALQSFIKGKSVLEATPVYQQVRDILYSIADREVISPKINGGMKVLIPSTLFEDVRVNAVTINNKVAYESPDLAFYSEEKDINGKRVSVNVCEIIIGRWFDSTLSDVELLKYLNETEEGQKILSGFAFRIPTQKQNSIEVFKIKHFLPREFGDSVVLPAAMVAKTGGDFDIDKLTMYLKNIYHDAKGNVKLIPFYGYGTAAKSKFRELYKELIDAEIEIVDNSLDKQSRLQTLALGMSLGLTSDKTINKWGELFREWFPEKVFGDQLDIAGVEEIFMQRIENLHKRLDKLTNQDLQEVMEDIAVEQWYKKSLQNEYIQSCQNLGANIYNYDRLIKPNSAEQLQDLAKEIAAKTIGKSFDYTNVGNMLDRTFMSRLRQAFVSGKHAIGIAAVNQTNHSLNQRQPIFIDKLKLKNLHPNDRFWLGDGEVKFQKYNKIIVGNRTVPTLSMIRNAINQDISDIISQFIDGYVDIPKGPWIMELGATPNVTSTWLFLTKLGVPIKTVAYFMNQPIVRDYLRSIEKAGYSYLFMDSFVEATKDKYASDRTITVTPKILPSETVLKANLDKVVRAEESKSEKPNLFNKAELEEQQFILDEFLKYAKMAEQLFHVTQGSNFDTANFNDPYLIFKKLKQLEKAQNTIINSVDDLLSNSFVGQLGETIQKLRNALSVILKSDQTRVRGIIERVLTPYTDMSDQDFVKLAQKAVSDLFDYAVQTDPSGDLNKFISNILLEKGGVAKEVQQFMDSIKKDSDHPLYDNYIVGKDGIMKAIASQKINDKSPNNLRVRGLGNKVYDQNNIIYAFRSIRDYLGKGNPLYNRIVKLAVLQSGLSSSGISFTAVLPHEDFEKIYNKVLSKLETISDLEAFAALNVFQRNNWNNSDIVNYDKAPLIKSRKTGKSFYNPAMEFLSDKVKAAIKKGDVPQLMTVRKNNKNENLNHLVFNWEAQEELLTPAIREQYKHLKLRKYDLLKKVKADMRSKGDFSYIYKGLFEKVTDNYGVPLETSYVSHTKNGDVTVYQYVYKAINAWGDGPRANEFYTNEKASIIDNGFIKVEGVDNNVIIDIFIKDPKSGISNLKALNVNLITRSELLEDYSQKTGKPLGLPEIKRPRKNC